MLCPKILYASDQPCPAGVAAAVELLRGELVQQPISQIPSKEPPAACVVPVLTRDDLDQAFRSARFLCSGRGYHASTVVLVNPKLCLPDSVTADFEDLGCRISFTDEPSALAKTLALARCVDNRIRKRGYIMIWDGSGDPMFQGSRGRSAEVTLSAGEQASLRALFLEQRSLTRYEIAAITGYDPDEIQVFIQRIRRKIKQLGRRIGARLSAQSVIRTVKGEGYRLVVRIRQPR